MKTLHVHKGWPHLRRAWRLPVRALLTAAAAAGLAAGLAAAPASAAVPPSGHGLTPASAVVGTTPVVAYTATDSSVWVLNQSTHAYTAAGGRLTAGPAAIASGASVVLFGRGTDGALWTTGCSLTGGCGPWQSVGGAIVSKPAAVFRGPGVADYSVYVTGTDGAVYGRNHVASGWAPWYVLGGRLLPGTGPAAAFLNGATYVLAAGTNRELYLQNVGTTGFAPVGGLTTATPALAALPSAQGQPAALVGFARGTDNVGYYHRFLNTSPGWHSMGGAFTSGLAASTQVVATIPDTIIFGLGTDSHIYQNTATWAAYPPSFGGWKFVS